jgi:hypothetical protein
MNEIITHLIVIISLSVFGGSNYFLFDDLTLSQQFIWAVAVCLTLIFIGLLIFWDCGLFGLYLK